MSREGMFIFLGLLIGMSLLIIYMPDYVGDLKYILLLAPFLMLINQIPDD